MSTCVVLVQLHLRAMELAAIIAVFGVWRMVLATPFLAMTIYPKVVRRGK